MFIRFWVSVFDIAVTGIGANDDDGMQEVTWEDEAVVAVMICVVGDDMVVVAADVELGTAD